MPLGQAAISQVSSVLESGDTSKILRRLSSGDQFTAADGTAANGMEQAHILTRQKHISSSSVGSFDVIDVENLYETGIVHTVGIMLIQYSCMVFEKVIRIRPHLPRALLVP